MIHNIDHINILMQHLKPNPHINPYLLAYYLLTDPNRVNELLPVGDPHV